MWGPYKFVAFGGFRLFLTIVDDFTRATWFYLMKSKDEFFSWFHYFLFFLENQFNVEIKIVRFDNGTKYVNVRMKSFFESRGIVHQTSIFILYNRIMLWIETHASIECV